MTAREIESKAWIALVIGNSRLHWALFYDQQLQQTWHVPHGPVVVQSMPQHWSDWQQRSPAFHQSADPYPELWLASVVPPQTQLWQHYPQARVLQRTDVPLQQMYPAFGLDRAIALWGAGVTYGWPCLVIDGGTALTLTGADANATLIGGAILPGLRLQTQALHQNTAELPLIQLPDTLPDRWARETETAIQSGIIYMAIAGLKTAIEQWWGNYPESPIVFTGGDANLLTVYLKLGQSQEAPLQQWPDYLLTTDEHLIFRGMEALRNTQFNKS